MEGLQRPARGLPLRPGHFGYGDSIRIPERVPVGQGFRDAPVEEPLAPIAGDAAAPAAAPAANQAAHFSPARRAVIVICAMAGFFFSTLDAAIVATSLMTISKDLDDLDTEEKDKNHQPWIVLSYLLTYMGFAVFSSQVSDIIGRRDAQLVSWFVFLCFSLGCATSKSMLELFICRAFQGIGGSGLYTLSQVTLTEYGPTHNPPLVGIIIGVTLALALILGPILGGELSRLSADSWRWIFNLNIPFSAVTMTVMAAAWPMRPEEPSLSSVARPAFGSLDYFGSGALLSAVAFLVFVLQEAGSGVFDWSDTTIIVCVAVAVASLALFVGWEATLNRGGSSRVKPAFPLHLLSNRALTSALLVTLLTGYSYFSLMIIIPLRFQMVNGDNPFMAGLHLLPMLGAMAIGSFMGGAINSKTNFTSYTLVGSATLQVLGIGLLTTFDSATSDPRPQYAYQALVGYAAGLCFSAGTVLTALHVPRPLIATGHGILSQARILGGCVGIAACTVVSHHHQWDAGDVPHETGEGREAQARAFYENVKIMLCLAGATVFVSVFTVERNPPQMQALRAHRVDLNKEEPRGSLSSGGTELQDLSGRSVRREGRV